MLYLKACPRCRGDVKFERDIYGLYLECIQCGYWAGSDGNGSSASSSQTEKAKPGDANKKKAA